MATQMKPVAHLTLLLRGGPSHGPGPPRSSADAVATGLHLLRRWSAENALRFEHQDQDQDGEHHGLRPPLGESVGGAVVQALDDADQQSAEDGAVELADATHHGCSEGDQTELEAGVESRRADALDIKGAGG